MNLKFLPIFQETEKNSDLYSEEIYGNCRIQHMKCLYNACLILLKLLNGTKVFANAKFLTRWYQLVVG